MLIGKKKGEEDFYVKRADSPQVFLVKKYNLERINKRPIEFRDKTICNLADDNVTQVAVTRAKDSFTLVKDPKKTGDDAWKLTKPAGVTLDTSKVNDIVSAFKEWKASGFAEDSSPKATGLAKPTATVGRPAPRAAPATSRWAPRPRTSRTTTWPPPAPRTCSSPPSGRSTASW